MCLDEWVKALIIILRQALLQEREEGCIIKRYTEKKIYFNTYNEIFIYGT